MSFCIPKVVNRKIQKALKDGDFWYVPEGKTQKDGYRVKFDVESLAKMTPEERTNIFTKLAGKQYSQNINKRFASKFNVDISGETVADIVGRMTKVNSLRSKWEASGKAFKNKADWAKSDKAPDWAREYVSISNDVNDIVNPRNKMGIVGATGDFLKEGISTVRAADTLGQGIGRAILFGGDILTTPVLKSLKASMDLSFALRQGFKVATMNKSAYSKAFQDGIKQAFTDKGTADAAFNEFQARMISHPYYDKLVTNGKLAIGAAEEFFPTTVGDKLPVVGGLFKRSNNAFTVFSQSARMELASDLLEKYKLTGGELDDVQKKLVKDIAYLSNSITGRGGLGKAESIGPALNRIFFAPRYIRSAIDTFLAPFDPTNSPEIQKEAQKHLVKTMGAIGAILGTASLFTEVELNPKSTNFGYMKIPGSNSWVDLTAGLGQYIRMTAQIATGEKINAKGKTIKLGDPKTFKPETIMSVGGDFFKFKLSPSLSLGVQALSDKELYGGREVTPVNVAREAFLPITPNNAVEYLQNEGAVTGMAMIIGEGLGLGVKTPRY